MRGERPRSFHVRFQVLTSRLRVALRKLIFRRKGGICELSFLIPQGGKARMNAVRLRSQVHVWGYPRPRALTANGQSLHVLPSNSISVYPCGSPKQIPTIIVWLGTESLSIASKGGLFK